MNEAKTFTFLKMETNWNKSLIFLKIITSKLGLCIKSETMQNEGIPWKVLERLKSTVSKRDALGFVVAYC